MVPPHESDTAQLSPSNGAGDLSGDASAGANAVYDGGPRWQVAGSLPQPLGQSFAVDAAYWPAAATDATPQAVAGAIVYPEVFCPPPVAPPSLDPQTVLNPAGAIAPVPATNPSISAASPAHAESAPVAQPTELPRRSRLGEVPSWLISVVVHLVALIGLALVDEWWSVDEPRLMTALRLEERSLDSLVDGAEPQIEEIDLSSLESAETELVEAAEKSDVLEGVGFEDDLLSAKVEAFAPPADPASFVAAPQDQVLKSAAGGDLSGRGALSKGDMLAMGGGTHASEEAVALALRWIVAHQAADGGWSFDHSHGTRCGKQCNGPGNARNARNGATAMALLPLLGAGNTHQSGKYKESIDRGLKFLLKRQDAKTGSFHEPQGDMYSHGLSAIALCEAYAMSKDRKLHEPSQGAIDFIAVAQDPVGGGWRYAPRQPGDTSVVGWQMMALKSGLMGYLDVPPDTVRLAGRFLDHVQDGDGSHYGYTGSGGEPATTSIGLLCRMYMGWQRDHPPLVRGVEYLRKTGPSPGNMYYNYYATQVVHHFGGPAWKEWNAKMRDMLIDRQTRSGHAAGSWLMGDPFVDRGGRLYCTSLAAMVLEVYYRHLPIYREESVGARPAADKPR